MEPRHPLQVPSLSTQFLKDGTRGLRVQNEGVASCVSGSCLLTLLLSQGKWERDLEEDLPEAT